MKSPWAEAHKLLAVQLHGLADVLMASPALQALRHGAPDTSLTLLTSDAGAAAAALLGCVDRCIPYAAPWLAPTQAPASTASDRALVERLSAEAFDAAVIFTPCTESALPEALICRLAGIPLRLAHAREDPHALLTDWVPDTGPCATGPRHEVQRQLDLVQHVGYATTDDRMQLHYAPEDAWSMRERMVAAGGRMDVPYLVVHPGAPAPAQRYPAQRYGEAAQALAARTGYQVVFTGSANEAALIAQAGALMRQPYVNLAGQLQLGQLAALIAGGQAVLCNNTEPAQMAAALGTPVVVLHGMASPAHAPWRARARVLSHDVPCRHCWQDTCPQSHHDCLTRIEVPVVVQAVLAVLDTPPAVPLSSMGRMQRCPWDMPLGPA